MKRRTAAAVILAGAVGLALGVPIVSIQAGAPNEQACPGLSTGQIDAKDAPSVTYTAPEGQLITAYCVKAGSENQGDGPVIVQVDPPQSSITFSYPGRDAVSHYSIQLTSVTTTTAAPTTFPTPNTFGVPGGDTTTTQPGGGGGGGTGMTTLPAAGTTTVPGGGATPSPTTPGGGTPSTPGAPASPGGALPQTR
jgi:hypothetical protein